MILRLTGNANMLEFFLTDPGLGSFEIRDRSPVISTIGSGCFGFFFFLIYLQ